MTNTASNLTRRQTLAGIGTAAAFVSFPANALATTGTDSAAWDKAMREFKKAEEEWEQTSRLHDAMEARFYALRPSLDMIDKKNLPCMTPTEWELEKTLDLDRLWTNFLAGEGKTWWAINPAKRKAEVRKAIDSVQSYRDQLDHAAAVTKKRHYEEATDAACDRMAEARDVLMEMPAPHATALLWKLEFFLEDTVYEEGFVAPTIADARRLLGSNK